MRIFIVQNTALGVSLPLSIYLTDFLRNFKKKENVDINLIVSKSNKIPNEILNLCNNIYQINSDTYSIKGNINFGYKTYQILKKENNIKCIDIVHCFYPNSSLMGATLFKKTQNKKTKLIYDVRSPWIDMSVERGHVNRNIAKLYKMLAYRGEKYLCKNVDSFIFITNELSKYYKERLCIGTDQKIYVSPSGIDTKLFRRTKTHIRKKYGVMKKDILIGSVGGLAKIRELDKFLDIFKDVCEKRPNVKLMFVGNGDALEELKKKTNELNLTKNVIFTGEIKHTDVPKYISAFDYGLCHLPNIFIYRNSFPLKILEYLACGVPVLGSDIKAHRKIKKEISAIHIYKKSDCVLNLVSKKEKIKIGTLKNYSWDKICKNYRKIYFKEFNRRN